MSDERLFQIGLIIVVFLMLALVFGEAGGGGCEVAAGYPVCH